MDGSPRPRSSSIYRIHCWGDLASSVASVSAGEELIVVGWLAPYDYTTRNGERRVALDLTASSVVRLHTEPK